MGATVGTSRTHGALITGDSVKALDQVKKNDAHQCTNWKYKCPNFQYEDLRTLSCRPENTSIITLNEVNTIQKNFDVSTIMNDSE